MTCRSIKKETIPDAKQRELAEVDGKIPDEWAAIQYNGNRDTFELKETGQIVSLPGGVVESNDAGHD